MKKILASFTVAVLLFSGCGLLAKDPLATVNDSIAKMAQVKQSKTGLILKGTVKSPAGQGPQNMTFDMNMSGVMDATDYKSPVLDLAIKGDVSVDGQSGSGDFMLRAVNKKMFINLKDIQLAGDMGKNLKGQMSSLFNAWWTLPADDKSNPLFAQTDEDHKKMQDLITGTKFFKTATEDGKEVVEGIPTTRYRVDLDKTALQQFIVGISRMGGNAVPAAEEQSLADGLKDVEVSGLVWIGDDDGMLHRVKGTVAIQPAAGVASSIDFDYTGSEYGKAVSVTEPQGAQDFNPLMLLPLVGALQQSAVPPATDSTTPVPTTPGKAPTTTPAPKTPVTPAKKK